MKKIYSSFRAFALEVLDWLTKKRGVNIKLNGTKLYLPGRYLRYFPFDYEEDNFNFLKKKVTSGMTCLDIGGHIGVYAIYMAKQKASKVFSFEPTPASFETIKKTIALNQYEEVIFPLQIAIAEKTGKSFFYSYTPILKGTDKSRIAEVNSFSDIDLGKTLTKDKIMVNTISIDDFAEMNNLKIDFIKIDTEGAELGILKGAKKTLLKDRPSGILAIHQYTYIDINKELSEIWEIMTQLNFGLLYKNNLITKKQFLTTSDNGLLDLQFFPI